MFLISVYSFIKNELKKMNLYNGNFKFKDYVKEVVD